MNPLLDLVLFSQRMMLHSNKREVIDLTDESEPTSKRSKCQNSSWQPFYLLTSEFPSSKNNTGCLSMNDVFSATAEDPIQSVVLFNYMVDMNWLLDEMPILSSIPLMVYHGTDQHIFTSFQKGLPYFTAAKVDIQVPYGTHHSKMGFIFYRCGVRMFIGTNNLIHVDNTYKTQAIWVQDFPRWTSTTSLTPPCEFREYLQEYLHEISVDKYCPQFEKATSQLMQLNRSMSEYDFSSSEVILVASVPGSHTRQHMNKWGHMRMRSILSKYPLPVYFDSKCPLLIQVSSLGSMGKDEKVVEELTRSLAPCPTTRLPAVELVWPTLDSIRTSAQGYSAGKSVCCNSNIIFNATAPKGVLKTGFSRILRQWVGTPSGRELSTPHMKSYFRYREQDEGTIELGWFLLTSSNLSQAAWGVLQVSASKLFIKSFEMGVLFHPARLKTQGRLFSCTPDHPLLGISPPRCTASTASLFKISVTASELSNGHVAFPVPFSVPPPQYSSSDSPWVWDQPRVEPDSHGNTFEVG